MTATLQQLLAPQTIEEIFSRLLAVYQAQGFPTTSWQTGGVDRTRTLAIATALLTISADYIPSIAAGGLLDYAALLENPDWIRLLAEQTYDLEYNRSSFTVGNMTLTAGSAGYTITAGQVIVVFPATGNRYINSTGGVLASSGTLELDFTAEFAGAQYNDASNGTITLVTALPGVTVTNPSTDYTEVSQVGSGVGTVTPSGTPVGAHQVVIRIDTTGDAGVAAWSYSLDGSPYVSVGSEITVSDLGGTGIDVTLIDGSGGTNFVEDDTYSFNTPGSWITTQGSDDEANQALATRCRNRWSSLSGVATTGYYELLATSTPDVGSQVVHVSVLPDEDINNKVNCIVAGPEGILPPATITAIQTYIDGRTIGTDYVTVSSPSAQEMTYGGTLTVGAAYLAAAQDAADAAMNDFTNDGGVNPTFRIAEVIDRLMDIDGMVDAASITINGSSSNVTLGSASTFVVGVFDSTSFTWVTV